MNTKQLISSFILGSLLLFPADLYGQAKAASPGSQEDIKAIMALPYLQGYFKAPEQTNVVLYDRGLSQKGYNLYSSGHAAYAALIDMKGHVLHEWAYDIHKVWPGKTFDETTPFWENMVLLPNGDLIAVYHNGGVIKIDKDSKLIWSYDCTAHHDIDLDSAGNIYTLTNDWVKLKPGVLITDNDIIELSPDGKLINKISLLALMHNSKNPSVEPLLKRVVGMALVNMQDVYHSNTLQIIDDKTAINGSPVFKKGNVLISMLTLSTLAVIDPKAEEIVWVAGPRIWSDGQHNATLLPNGNMMTFDNHFKNRKDQSRVIEFKPITKEIIWEYTEKGFYSDTHGSEQRLENGNTLIIEANKGRVFEVTPDKKIVWEFLNPHKTGKDLDLIPAVFALYRVDPATTSSWLK